MMQGFTWRIVTNVITVSVAEMTWCTCLSTKMLTQVTCEIEYDLGFFCSTDCLVRSMQLHEVTYPHLITDYQDSVWEEE